MNPQDNLSSTEPNLKTKNIQITSIAILVTAIIVGSGVYIWQKQILSSAEQLLQEQIMDLQRQVNNLQEEEKIVSTNPEAREEPKVEEKAAAEKVYRNQLYGFEFRYPENVLVTDISDTLSEPPNTEFLQELVLTTYERKEIPQVYSPSTCREMHFSFAEAEDFSGVGGAPTEQISRSDERFGQLDIEKSIVVSTQGAPHGTWVLSYDFNYQGDRYKFNTWTEGFLSHNPFPKSTEDLMEQILSTLKFTN